MKLILKKILKKFYLIENYKNEMIKKANIHFKKFNWRETVNQTLKILED